MEHKSQVNVQELIEVEIPMGVYRQASTPERMGLITAIVQKETEKYNQVVAEGRQIVGNEMTALVETTFDTLEKVIVKNNPHTLQCS